jgi:hypothetical protein
MKDFKKATVAVLVAGLGFTEVSGASLIDRGGGMIYDSDQNITWLADANLFKTQSAGNANLVSEIIAANIGVTYESPYTSDMFLNHGNYSLRASDFNTSNGKMTWFGAKAWAYSLVVGGYNDWRLPTTNQGFNGFDKTSELSHLFYDELGGIKYQSIANIHNSNYDFFSNVPSSAIWLDRDYSSDPYYSWVFYTNGGAQNTWPKNQQLYAWAVRTGDVATVPVPTAIWLFGSSLGLFAFSRRRKS